MPKFEFNKLDTAGMLGYTPISQVSDKEIWRQLVSPTVKGLLGPIVRKDPARVQDTLATLFSGDEVTNLNDHRLYGGQKGFVRFPFIVSFYRTTNGAFIVKRDGMKFEALGVFGDVDSGKGELIFKVGLRDRRFDGTVRANDSAMLDFPYDDPDFQMPLSDELSSVELSIYGYMPGSRVLDVTGEQEYDDFVRQPFGFLHNPDLFLTYFNRAWKTRRAPGQHAAPIPDLAKFVMPGLERIALACGYDLIEMAPSHFHVCKWGTDGGYIFADDGQAQTLKELSDGLEKIRAAGKPLTRTQQSWVCVVQSLRPTEKIPADLYLAGPEWPQDNIDKRCLWLYKPLSERAKGFKPHRNCLCPKKA